MAVEITNLSKTGGGSVYPIHAVDTSGNFDRIEPLITPEILIKDWLFAVPLYDRVTNTRMTNEDLKRTIVRAIRQLELELKINIFPVERQIKMPFDYALFKYFGHLEIPYKPIHTLLSLYLEDSNFNNIYTFPPSIIETRNMWMGQLNFGPVTVQTPTGLVFNEAAGGGGGVLLLVQTMMATSMPAFYVIDCITGFPDSQIPGVINELIGITAALEVISRVSPIFKVNSQSISHDGLSQSISGPGPQVFAARIADLKEKKAGMLKQLKHLFYNSIFVSNI
jgi:hypothetical protein